MLLLPKEELIVAYAGVEQASISDKNYDFFGGCLLEHDFCVFCLRGKMNRFGPIEVGKVNSHIFASETISLFLMQ